MVTLILDEQANTPFAGGTLVQQIDGDIDFRRAGYTPFAGGTPVQQIYGDIDFRRALC